MQLVRLSRGTKLCPEAGSVLPGSLQSGRVGDQQLPTGLCSWHFWPGGWMGQGGVMWNERDNDIFDMNLCTVSEQHSQFKSVLLAGTEEIQQEVSVHLRSEKL